MLFAGFLLGGLVTGVLLGDFFKTHETHYVGLERNVPIYLGVFLSNLFVSILVVWILYKTNNTTWKKGFMISAMVLFLVIGNIDLFSYSVMNLYDFTWVISDTIINTILGGILGAIAGAIPWWRKKSRFRLSAHEAA